MEKTAKGGSRRPAMRGARVARAPVSTLPAVDIAEATATEAGDVDTFSDDLTPAQLSARPLQPGPPRKASSQNQYDKTGNKHWTLFCKAAGWDAEKKSNFLDDDCKPCDGTFQNLFVWLYEQKVSKAVFKTMLAWAQAELNEQLLAKNCHPMDNYVGTLPGVIQRKKAVYSSSRWEAMEAMQDLQADINADIGFDGMDKMIRLCLSHKIPQTSGFFSQQTLLELRATHQMCARHDDLRAEVFAHMFARMAPRVGPAGMSMLCCVVDGGKTNKNGNISYSAILPHANPLHCTIFAKGAWFLYRFLVLKAPFPNVMDPHDIFKRRVLRTAVTEFHAVTYNSSADVMKRLFSEANIKCTKVLHQGRGEGQRELEMDDVNIDQIRRLCHYVHDDQCSSYLLHPPTSALLSRAGYNWQAPGSAYAPHLSVTIDDSLVDTLLPPLREAQSQVDEAMKTASSVQQVCVLCVVLARSMCMCVCPPVCM